MPCGRSAFSIGEVVPPGHRHASASGRCPDSRWPHSTTAGHRRRGRKRLTHAWRGFVAFRALALGGSHGATPALGRAAEFDGHGERNLRVARDPVSASLQTEGSEEMLPVIKSVELPNDVKLPYVEQGDPSGVPLLFLHGITDSWRSFESLLPHLPASIHAFALSQRGHGDADRPVEGYHPRDFAADLVVFMDTVGLERAVLVGHSMGSYIAQRFAMDYPGRTRGLVLMGSFTTLRGNPEVTEFWDSVVSTLEDPIDPDFAREFQVSTLAQPVPRTLLDMAVQESLKVPARVWRAAFGALMQADFSGELGKIQAPTLIVWGDQDALFLRRSEQEILAANIPNSKLVVYPGAGHALHWEDPRRVAADLVNFSQNLVG
jgi:non-heme chloroperoxidase